MNFIWRYGRVLGVTGLVALAVVLPVSADRMTSPSFQIDTSVSAAFGGQTSSANYKMVSAGGEAFVGNGSSGSYILRQGYAPIPGAASMKLTVQPNGLVAYYPLDENTGTTTADGSAYQNNGTINSPAGWYASGKIGSSVDMEASGAGNGSVMVPDNANLPSGGNMSFEGWVVQSSLDVNKAIATHWNYPASGSWAIQTGPNGNLRVFIAGSQTDTGDNYVDTPSNSWTPSAGVWRHVAMTFDGSQPAASRVKIYINGNLMTTTMSGTIPSTLQNSSGSFAIGHFPGLGRSMNGAIDHVKLFNRTLGANEVASEYTAQNAGVVTGVGLGTLSASSSNALLDTIVRTDSSSYGIAVQQDHNLQSGSNTIPSVAGSIASPSAWSEGTTKGFGFTLFGAPTLDSKWGSGGNYAAFPNASTTFYSGTGHSSANVDVINARLKAAVDSTQVSGSYTNNLTFSGTTLP